MHIASLELSKQLFEVSGWGKPTFDGSGETAFVYYSNADEINDDFANYRPMVIEKDGNVPAYDLGFLLRKLPKGVTTKYANGTYYKQVKLEHIKTRWCAYYSSRLSSIADTPEDCAVKLAIELFKQGILVK
jgi:hypothetical protein